MKSLVVLACLALAAPASAQSALVSAYDEAVLREVVEGLGYKVTDTLVDPTGEPAMTVQMAGDLAFQIEGMFCEGEGKDQRCQGLQMAAIIGDSGSEDPVKLAAEINRTWRPGKLFVIDRGLAFERYLILDDGISRGNLASNIETFGEMLKQLWARIHG